MEKIKYGTSFIYEKELYSFEFDASMIGTLNHSHLYIRKDKQWVLVKKAGEFFCESDFEKLNLGNIKQHNLINKNQEQIFNQYFNELKTSKKSETSKELMDLFLKTLVNDVMLNSSSSIFTFAYSCFKNLYKLPQSVVQEKLNSNLSSRAFIASSINLYNSMVLGIFDFSFYEDIYNCSYLFDFSQVGVLDDRAKVISNIEDCLEQASAYKSHFSNESILNLIKIQHEQIDGTGYPNNENYKSLSLIQSSVIFTQNIIPKDLDVFGAEDANYILMANVASYFKRSHVTSQILIYWQSLLREYFFSMSSLAIEESA